jgi:histone H3/H4
MPADTVGCELRESQRFQRLRAALELAVHDILGEVGVQHSVQFSGQVSAIVTELVVDKVERTAEDLEAFASHAKRTTITSEDVRLLTRRNSELNARLTALSRDQSGPVGGKRGGGKQSGGSKRKAQHEEEGETGAVGKKGRNQPPVLLID